MEARGMKVGPIALAALGLLVAIGPALASDNKIAVVPGGPHPYFAPWADAAADAQKAFGIADVEYKVPADWKLELQTELLESLVSQGFKGFGIFPGDPVGVNSTITELKGSGVPVVMLGGCAQDPSDAAFCFATDPYKTTYTMAKALIAAMGGKGNLVHVTGQLIDTNTTLREQAVQKAVDETNGAVKLLQTVADADLDPSVADQKVNALLAASKDQIDGIVATGHVASAVTAKALRALGDKRIKFIAFDDDQAVLDDVKDGFAQATYEQNPYGQAYIGAYALDLLAGGCTINADAPWIKTPQTTRFIDLGVLEVTAANLPTYKDDIKKLTAGMQSTFKATYLTCK